jgi:hypothetical protein
MGDAILLTTVYFTNIEILSRKLDDYINNNLYIYIYYNIYVLTMRFEPSTLVGSVMWIIA